MKYIFSIITIALLIFATIWFMQTLTQKEPSEIDAALSGLVEVESLSINQKKPSDSIHSTEVGKETEKVKTTASNAISSTIDQHTPPEFESPIKDNSLATTKTNQHSNVDEFSNLKSNQPMASIIIKKDNDPKPNLIKEMSKQEDLQTEKKAEADEQDLKFFTLVNEKSQPIFDGKKIPIKKGKIKLDKNTSIDIHFKTQNDFSIRVNSNLYFCSPLKNEIIQSSTNLIDFQSLKNDTFLTLCQYSFLHIKLNYPPGMEYMEEGSSCKISSNNSISPENRLTNNGRVNGDIAIFKSTITGDFIITDFISDKYTSQYNKAVSLQYGETTETEIEIFITESQSIKILDENSRPLENYYAFLQRKGESRNKYRYFEYQFRNTGEIKLEKNLVKTDIQGLVNFESVTNDEYECYIFGPDYVTKKFNVKITEKRETIELQMTEESREISLQVFLNGSFHENDIGVKYIFSNHPTKFRGRSNYIKVDNGETKISNLKAGYYHIEIESNDYFRESAIIDLTESLSANHAFDLKPAENYIHGYILTSAGSPEKNVSVHFESDRKRYHVSVDSNGYFKFSGLNPDKTYKITSVNKAAKLPGPIKPGPDEIIIKTDSFIDLKGLVLGQDEKPVSSFSLVGKLFEADDPELTKSRHSFYHSGSKNGEFSLRLPRFGYYEFTIKLSNAPDIKRVIPLLKDSDNTLSIFQAEPGLMVQGTIYDFFGNPLEGVAITRRKSRSPIVNKVEAIEFITDKEGIFKISNCLVGETYYLAKVGYPNIEIPIPGSFSNLQYFFPRIFKLNGVVVDANNKPLPNIRIGAYPKENQKAQLRTVSKEDGTFTFESILAGEWFVYLRVKSPPGQGNLKPGQDVLISDGDAEVRIIYDTKN